MQKDKNKKKTLQYQVHLIKNLILHLMIDLEKNLFRLIEKKVLKLLLNLKNFTEFIKGQGQTE
jgi:hypothetical protein